MVKDCIVGSAYTYKVQVGYTVIGLRKEGTIRNYFRYVLSKSSIHSNNNARGQKSKKTYPS